MPTLSRQPLFQKKQTTQSGDWSFVTLLTSNFYLMTDTNPYVSYLTNTLSL